MPGCMQILSHRFPQRTGGLDTHMQALYFVLGQPATDSGKVIHMIAKGAMGIATLLEQTHDQFLFADINA
jgi:hypothetical protein